MDKEIHRLENLLFIKEQVITELNTKLIKLEQELEHANQQIESLNIRATNNFSYKNVPDREIIQTLEAKLASSSWEILELQRINMKYEENLIKLQSDLLSQGQELGMKSFQLETNFQINDLNDFEEKENIEEIKKLEAQLKHKDKLIDEIVRLKNKVRDVEFEMREKMVYYINELANLSAKIKSQGESEKVRSTELEKVISKLNKENDQLRKHIEVKNEHITAYFGEMKNISTDKLSDMNTIRNLRREITKKEKDFHKVLVKLGECEQVKKKLLKYSNTCSESLGEFDKLIDKLETMKRENGVLKEKLEIKEQLSGRTELLMEENNKKLYELLVENEACHKLLYEARGCSNLFTDDVEQKVTQFINSLEKRRENSTTWLDVSELIAFNQKMRIKRGDFIENQID